MRWLVRWRRPVVEDLEGRDWPKDFLLDDRGVDVVDFDQAGPVERAGGERTLGYGPAADDRSSVAARIFNDPIDAGHGSGVDQRAHLGVLLLTRADNDI